MFTIKNDQALLYFLLNKIIKEPETNFQAPVLNKNVRNVCHTAHYYLTKFHFDSSQDSKEIGINITSIMSQCL